MSGLSDKQKHEELLQKMEVGESFFLPGVLPQNCGYIRKLGYKLKLRLSIRFVEQDTIYGTHGTRVMRLKDGKVSLS